MYLIKNAWKNVIRSKGRNLLIGLIVLVISTSACISLSIRESAENIEESGLENTEITGQIAVDRQSMMKSMEESNADQSQMKEKISQTQELSVSALEKYATAKSVKNFYYTMTTSLNGNNIEEISSENMSDEDDSSDSNSQNIKNHRMQN